MTLIKEDWYVKPPTAASRKAALPAFATAAWMALAPWLGQAEAAHATMGLEFVFLLILFLGGSYAGSGSRFVKWFGVLWVSVAFGVLAVFIAISVGGAWPLVGFAFFAVANLPVLLKRDAIRRDMLMARGGVGFVLGWAYVFVGAILAAALTAADIARPDGTEVGAWGLLFFATWGLADWFRVLVAPPPDAGPGWWKWPRARSEPDAEA